MSAQQAPHIPFSSGLYHVAEGFAPPDVRVAAANTVAHLHKTSFQGHILVYAPGAGEIDTICTMIRKATKGKLDVFPLYSAMPSESQEEALRVTKEPKCIVATSLAMDTPVRSFDCYVVDTGLCKEHVYNPRLNMHTLETRLISRPLASRREGLATERYSGACIRLYSASALLAMPTSKYSNKASLSAHVRVFDRLARGGTDLTRAGWTPRLHPDDLARVAQDLVVWDLVDEHGTLTERGKCVSRITINIVDHSLEPVWANAIYEASKLGCMDEVITIAALCSIQKNVFQDEAGMERIASISRAKFAHGPSDHLALLNAFMQYQQLVDRDESRELCKVWCRLHFLNFGALQDASELRTAIKTAASGLQREEDDTTTQRYTPETTESRTEASSGTMKSERGFCSEDDCYSAHEDHVNDDDDDLGAHEGELDEEMIFAKIKADPRKHANILKAITRAFSTQIAISLGSGDKYCTVDTNVTAMLHASCALVDLQPQWVVYTQLSRRSRLQFLDIVSVVDTDWLLDLPNFQPDALARDNGKIRQAAVKDALDAARVKATVAQLSRAL